MSIDHIKKFQNEVQNITDDSINEIDNITSSKELEILKV